MSVQVTSVVLSYLNVCWFVLQSILQLIVWKGHYPVMDRYSIHTHVLKIPLTINQWYILARSIHVVIDCVLMCYVRNFVGPKLT